MADNVRITFGMIVLNGEPFTRYNLRSLYPFAHQIIVVEGACPAARGISAPDGHSLDGTLDLLRRFQVEEDPENKLTIVTAEDEGHPDGFWTEKDEMSQAYAKRATGNYLWQVDSDEFYKEEDVRTVIDMLEADPEITAVSFRQITFWGDLSYAVDSYYLRNGADVYHRLFRWDDGYTYERHRPPTVTNDRGVDLRTIKHVRADVLSAKGILLYHYSLLFPAQVLNKSDYYSAVKWADRSRARVWADQVYDDLKHPFRVHNVYEYVSWLVRYDGVHPKQVLNLKDDIERGLVYCRLRDCSDIEAVLSSPVYRILRSVLIAFNPIYRRIYPKLDKYSYFLRRKLAAWRGRGATGS